MPKLHKTKVKIYDLDQISDYDKNEIIGTIGKANSEQFGKLASSMVDATNLAKSISSLASSFKLPVVDFLKDLKLPEIPTHEPMDFDISSFERYDPPVTIKKSDWEIKKEAREIYRTELQIQVLEQQLNIYKGMYATQYDINTGVISFLGKQIKIPLNTNLEMVCRTILKNLSTMKKKWSWDEIIETWNDVPEKDDWRKVYNAGRAINEQIEKKTTIGDFLIVKTKTLQLNPEFLR